MALNGSHRGEAGCTQWLLNKIAEGAVEAGGEFETVVLASQRIKPCAGCEACNKVHPLQCIYEQEDDVAAIFNKMKAADILIFATPVYVFSISGLMKTFIDRFNSTLGGEGNLCLTESGLIFHRVDKGFHSKPFVVLTCCGNVEAETVKNVVSYFKTFSRFVDAPIVGVLVRNLIGMMGIGETQEGVQPKPVIAEVTAAYVQAGRELVRQGRIASRTQKQANQHILGIPFLDLLMKSRFFKKMALKRHQT